MRGNSDRFFYGFGGLGEECLEVTDKDLIKQWRKVLRLTDGDVVRLFDGRGWEYEYKFSISNFQFPKNIVGAVHEPPIREKNSLYRRDKSISLKLIDKKFFEEPKGKLVLGFGLLKSKERMEWLIEKVTELGVDEIVPLAARYSQVDRLRGKERLEKKIIEACEQCGRVRMPEIRANFQFSIFNFQTDIEKYYYNFLKICFDGRGERIDLLKLKSKIMENNNKVLLMMGPEGGWSEEEYDWFKQNGFLRLSLGDNVLRAETAGVMGVGVMKLTMNN